MQLRSEIQITSIIKAMVDVVLPALDPENKLAVEQGQLVVGMLRLMETQLPLQFRFDRDELQRLLGAAAELEAICQSEATDELAMARARSSGTLANCTIDPAELHQAIGTMRTAIGDTIYAVGTNSTDESVVARAEKCVLKLSREQLLRDRSLLISQGWELDPDGLTPIEELLST